MSDNKKAEKKLYEQFYPRFNLLRIENNYSQEEIATQLNITTGAVSKWEQEKSMPSLDNISKIAELFNVSYDYLLGKSDERNINQPSITYYKDIFQFVMLLKNKDVGLQFICVENDEDTAEPIYALKFSNEVINNILNDIQHLCENSADIGFEIIGSKESDIYQKLLHKYNMLISPISSYVLTDEEKMLHKVFKEPLRMKPRKKNNSSVHRCYKKNR